MNDMPSLQQRVGNRYWGGGDAMARAGLSAPQADGSWTQSAFWGRIEGSHEALQPNTTTGSTSSTDDWKAQVGIDALLLENGNGRLIAGVTGHYGTANANVTSVFGNGTIKASGSGIGATLTWYGNNGFYVDGQAQGSWYNADLNSVLAGSMTHGNRGDGYAAGVEIGKRFGLGSGFWLTPQAQIAYSQVSFNDFADRFAALVSLDRADSLLGRVGLALENQRAWHDAFGQVMRSDLYGIANLHYEFLGGTNVLVSGTSFANANDRLWASVGGGGTFSWANGRYSIYGEVSYNASVNDAASNFNYKGTGGFRLTW
jgi:outer membrane autotransporter protein